VDKEFYKNFRDHYKAILHQLERAFKEKGLPHETDPSVFDARRLMRLPGTVNRKPHLGADVPCTLIQGKIVPINFDISLASGLPTIKPEEQIDKEYFKRFPKVENEAVLNGCNFLKFSRENPDKIQEPQWYALLSITARMEEGHKLSHEISKGHKSYSPNETDLKINQALTASGPRTCASINQVWGKCHACPNFQKLNSPIMLRSAETIKTEATGFHNIVFDPETGRMKIGKPNFEDLLTFFQRSHKFVSHDKFCWTWKTTHWEEIGNSELENFAQRHFDPFVKSESAEEFRKLVHRWNLVDPKEMAENSVCKVNFKNGVLDLKTGKFGPHEPDNWFKYTLPYDYDPKAKAPVFTKFLHEVTGGKEILIKTLLEFGGYSLSGDECKYAKALVLEGEGSNGKSTFIDILKKVAGRGSYQTLSFSEINSIDRRSALDGTLFNITEETPNKFMDTTTFKNLVSGGELNVRKLYKNSYPMRNRAKLIFSCNALPSTTDASRGFFRRFLIVPFNQTFSAENNNVDVHIQDKMAKELPGIFNMMLTAYHELKKRGCFAKQLQKDEDLMEYEQMADSLLDWYKSEVDVEDLASTKFSTVRDLYRSYAGFCEDSGIDRRDVIKKAIFDRRLRTLIPDYQKRASRAYIREDGERVRARALTGIICHIGSGDY
jgi:putative DNA primase/helicase